MKKFLLISANTFCDPYPVYPLGVTYLQTYLQQKIPSLTVEIFDCNLSPLSKLSAIADNFDVIGISFRNIDGANSLDAYTFLDKYREVVKTVRAAAADKPLIIGGAAFSLFPEVFMRELQADYGIAGEGEECLRKLFEALLGADSSTSSLSTIEGLYIRDKNNITVPHRNYLSSIHAQFDAELANFYWKESGMLNIQTKRGCPYNCVYCSYPIIDGRKVRTLNPDEIVENLRQLKRDKGISYVFFTDSIFNIHNEYNAVLAEKLAAANIGISWGAYFSPSNLTPELLMLFKRSGLTHIEFGTESFSDRVLVSYGKNFDFESVLKTSEMALNAGIFYAHFLILGGIGETEETLRETIEHSKQIQYTVFFPFVGMRIYPHTRLQQLSIEDGLISPDDTLLEPKYYLMKDFNLEAVRKSALATGKAWIFPDDKSNEEMMKLFRVKKNKKGPLWEYLRR
ncbi:MAG: radical SAM protein [Bacteroidales bacterium]|nr:radical SAM protein [Bacteroidales bacterium]